MRVAPAQRVLSLLALAVASLLLVTVSAQPASADTFAHTYRHQLYQLRILPTGQTRLMPKAHDARTTVTGTPMRAGMHLKLTTPKPSAATVVSPASFCVYFAQAAVYAVGGIGFGLLALSGGGEILGVFITAADATLFAQAFAAGAALEGLIAQFFC